MAGSGIPFLDLAANQVEFAKALDTAVAPSFDAMGLKIEGLTELPAQVQAMDLMRWGHGMAVPVRCWRLPACRGARPDGAPGWAQSL